MTCEDAAKVEATIAADLEKLGGMYNELEELTFNLECGDKRKDERIQSLEERIALMENSCNPENATQSEHVTTEPKIGVDRINQLGEQLAVHQTALACLSQSLRQVETRQPPSLSTHELTQVLIQRLKGGDMLSQSDLLELKGALPGSLGTLGHLPYTPSLTNAATLPSHSDTDVRLPQKRKAERLARPSLNGKNEDEPPVRRPRGRPPKPSWESITNDGPSLKKPRGRPPGWTLHRRSVLSNKSSVEPAQDDATTNNGEDITPVVDGDRASVEELNEVENSNVHHASRTHTALQTNPSESADLDSPRSQEPHMERESSGRNEPNTDSQSNVSDEPVDIPPERRSERMPKPAKKFGDVMTWAEAKAQMQSFNQRSPQKTRN